MRMRPEFEDNSVVYQVLFVIKFILRDLVVISITSGVIAYILFHVGSLGVSPNSFYALFSTVTLLGVVIALSIGTFLAILFELMFFDYVETAIRKQIEKFNLAPIK